MASDPSDHDDKLPALPPLGGFPPDADAEGDGEADDSGPALPEVAGMRSVKVEQDEAADEADSGVEAVIGAAPAPVEEGAPSDPFLGRSFGGYQLIEKIGHGGMGMVYRGRQVSLNRDVAVKLLNKALVDNDEFIKRFRREAQAMATIHHPNIVSVIDFGESDGIWYMVAEYVEGSNLAKWIREKVIVPVTDLVPIIIQCLSGLAYVSRNNIVHRDIKPDNILIDLENTAKIADFGLAKDIANNDTDLTAAGSAMGTPAYMSPEQCMGRNLDVRSDIYSLGVAAYFALTGEKPFTGSSSFEIMTKQREYHPPEAAQLNPQIPPPVSELVMRMIAKKPVDRFAGADECRDDWIGVATEIGLMGPVTRSGEFLLPVPPVSARPPSAESQARMAAVAYPDVDDQVPESPVADLGLPEPPPLPDPNAGDHVPRQLTPAPTSPMRPPGTEPISRPPTTRAQQSARHGKRAESTGEFMTCPRCGHLNQGHRNSCERCDTSFQETAPGRQDVTSMLAEAERLLHQGHYDDAARRFGKLAEMEQDRRQRSVLRAKEREARNHLEQQTLRETQQRSSIFVAQGNPKAALKLLERAKASQSAVMITEHLQSQIDEIRRQMSRRRRRRIIIVILALLVAAGVVAHHFFADQITALIRDWSAMDVTSDGGS